MSLLNFWNSPPLSPLSKPLTPPVQEESIDEAELYREIQGAQEILLAEAKQALISAPSAERQAQLESLYLLGFTNTGQQQEYQGMLVMKELQKLIETYMQEYPLNRFIDRDTVTRVCEKYNLYMVKADRYIDEIPDKNQKEIINFRIKLKHAREDFSTSNSWEVAMRVSRHRYVQPKNPEEKIPACHLVILAPEHKINMAGLKKVGRILVKDDPIVLQPVQGGFLIVSAWGPEAADAEVMNGKMN